MTDEVEIETAHNLLIKVILTSNSREELFKFLNEVEEPSILINFRDKRNGRQALHIACKKKKGMFLKDLLEKGADINS